MSRFPLRAILFDGDGTLWDFETSMDHALREAAAHLEQAGIKRSDGAITAAWLKQLRDELAALPEHSAAPMRDIRHASFVEAIRQCGSNRLDLATTVLESYMRSRFASTALYSDVGATLAALKGNFKLALVTNGNTHPETVGLGSVFDSVVIAADCGYRKPDPDIYRYAVERLSVVPEECLHVGDDPLEDVRAAKHAGLRAAWINRARATWNLDLIPDLMIRSLSELLEFVT